MAVEAENHESETQQNNSGGCPGQCVSALALLCRRGLAVCHEFAENESSDAAAQMRHVVDPHARPKSHDDQEDDPGHNLTSEHLHASVLTSRSNCQQDSYKANQAG